MVFNMQVGLNGMTGGGNGTTHHGGMTIETAVPLHLEGIIVQIRLHPHCWLQHPQTLAWSPHGLVVAPLVVRVSALFLLLLFYFGSMHWLWPWKR